MDWDAQLGWMRALVAHDEVAHRRALDRYLALLRDARDTRDAYQAIRARVPRSVSAEESASARYRQAAHGTPDVILLETRVSPEELPTWGGVPYAVIYLEWEAHHAGEWTRHAKHWSTKQHLIRRLAVPGHTPEIRERLVDLVEFVVQRRHRCKDREYSHIARAIDGDDLRARLSRIGDSGPPWARDQAGHVLWLLHNPHVPINRANWFRWLAAHRAGDGPEHATPR